ncbi:MAG: FAD-dependent oxidoreductase [Eubacteriales bacterium]
MRIVIIGAVAAGTSAAAKARRNTEDAEIVIYEKGQTISYSGCGMPYFLGGDIENESELIPRDAAFFKSKYNVDIYTGYEVMSVDPQNKKLQIKDAAGALFEDSFDRLLFATGANAVVPPIKGADGEHVFVLRDILDMQKIHAFIEKKKPQGAVIVGSGFIGMEMCESLMKVGIRVTLLEKQETVCPWLDRDMSVYVLQYLEKKGINTKTGVSVGQIEENKVVLADKTETHADLVLLAAGTVPNTALAWQAGVQMGVTGAIAVNERMETNLPDIYACGDCIEETNIITGKPVYCPLGSTANKTGRIAGDRMTGGSLAFRGILGTGIYKIFDLVVAKTGLSEDQAKTEGYDVAVCHNIKQDKPEYMHGQEMVIKAVADQKSGRLLGAQIIGYAGVDKRIDVFATAITFGAKAEDLFHLDLAYAPPFATTKDPVHYTGMILDNAIRLHRSLMTPEELYNLIISGKKYVLIDTRAPKQYEQGHIETARSKPIAF